MFHPGDSWTRVDLGLFRQRPVRQHRLILNFLLLGELLERVGIVVLPHQHVGELQTVLAELVSQLFLQIAHLGDALIAIELLGTQLAEVLLNGRVGKAHHHVIFIAASEAKIKVKINGQEIVGQKELSEGDVVEVAGVKASFGYQE